MLHAEASKMIGAGRLAGRWDAVPAQMAAGAAFPAAAVIATGDVRPLSPDLTVWDIWPVQLDNGDLAPVAGGDLWVILSAPRTANPDDRHNEARMRLIHRVAGDWHDCGPLFPDGFSPGSREWSGSTRLDPATGVVTIWFTAAGRRGDDAGDFEQRFFHATGSLDLSGAAPRVADWRDLTQSVDNDGSHYADLSVNQGEAGMIKGFRDPYWFRDPADGQGYLLFTASKSVAASRSSHDGVIGIAAACDANGVVPFELLEPLIDGDGQANEMERPHVFVQDGLYYLFWSTQDRVFAPGGLEGPTGLYGMVAPSLFGPYELLNGSGLVLANPVAEPKQAYAWQVIPGSLDVVSFIDFWGLEGRDVAADPALKAAQFGGAIAPVARIALNGATSSIVAGGA